MIYKIIQIEEHILQMTPFEFEKAFKLMNKPQSKEFATSVSKELMNALKAAKAEKEKETEINQEVNAKVEEYKKMFEDY